MKMKFLIENITKSGRIGSLILGDTALELQTPVLLQTTQSGSIPFLTPDAFKQVTKGERQLLLLSMDTMTHMAESLTLYKQGISSYIGYGGYPTMLAIRDPCEFMPSGFNATATTPLFTRKGKEPITAERYMDVIETFAPHIYQGMSDADTNIDSAKKRVQKSVERTNKFMDYCYERHKSSAALTNSALFVPIVGGYNKHNRMQSVQHSNGKDGSLVGGYILEGFHNYGTTATEVLTTDIIEIVRHCLDHLDDQKPRLMMGAFTPTTTLSLVQAGIDMFDTSYAYFSAVRFQALAFRFSEERDPQAEAPFVDLTSESMKEDFSPFLKDCTCLACVKHTRAYVHHLHKTNEMLGPILLMIHNLHHYMEYFKAIREAVKQDKVTELLKLVQYQGGDKEVDYMLLPVESKQREQRIE